MSKYYYVVVLFIILIPFTAFKLIADFELPNVIVIPVDVAVSLMMLLYWWEYARSSFHLDKPRVESPKEGPSVPTPVPGPKPKAERKPKRT